jgi:ABC-2 type transport system permease protein
MAIFEKEWSSYMNGSLLYVVVPAFLLMVGFFSLYFQDIFAAGVVSMRGVFFWCALSYLFLIPAMTMRSFAEEFRSGSFELMATMPIADEELVLGKFFSALALLLLTLAMTCTYPITLSLLGDLDWGVVFGGYVGLFLVGASFVAIGLAASASTSNQINAFLFAFVLSLIPFLIGYTLNKVPESLLPFVQYISFEYHFNNLARGVIDTRNLIFYGSIIALALHGTLFQLARRRLR